MAELKKCPFCSGEVMLDREDIFCDNCHLSMRIDDRKYNGEAETYEEAREQAIEAWNNRVTEAEIRAEAIRDFAENLKDNSYFIDDKSHWCGYVSDIDIDTMADKLIEKLLKGE